MIDIIDSFTQEDQLRLANAFATAGMFGMKIGRETTDPVPGNPEDIDQWCAKYFAPMMNLIIYMDQVDEEAARNDAGA